MPPKSRGLERQHLIVTEGRDDQIVVESLAAREGASHVQVMHCQGRDNLENKIRAVAAESGFEASSRSVSSWTPKNRPQPRRPPLKRH